MNTNEHASVIRSPDARRQRIVEVLDREGEQPVEALAERFAVSAMTIRRNLQDLEDEGEVIRTRGGAAPSPRVGFEFRFLERAGQAAEQKDAIADVAAGLITSGQRVLLDSSTTTLAIAQRLRRLDSCTVMTTSLPIASALFGLEHLEVILLGGRLRKDSPDMSGALTDQSLEVLAADVAFIGADSVDADGHAYNESMDVGRMLGRMAQAAEDAYLVADHTKFSRRALMRFADLRQWAGLITDGQADEAVVRKLRGRGVSVIQAQG